MSSTRNSIGCVPDCFPASLRAPRALRPAKSQQVLNKIFSITLLAAQRHLVGHHRQQPAAAAEAPAAAAAAAVLEGELPQQMLRGWLSTATTTTTTMTRRIRIFGISIVSRRSSAASTLTPRSTSKRTRPTCRRRFSGRRTCLRPVVTASSSASGCATCTRPTSTWACPSRRAQGVDGAPWTRAPYRLAATAARDACTPTASMSGSSGKSASAPTARR